MFHGYKHKCAAVFKHHRGPNFVDGLNTSYAESANAYTQSLKATVAKWGTLARATLYTEFFMMVYNLGRERFFNDNHSFATAATPAADAAAATAATDNAADVAAAVAIVAVASQA